MFRLMRHKSRIGVDGVVLPGRARLQKLYILVVAAVVAAILIVLTWKSTPLGDDLVRDNAVQALPEFSDTARKETPEVDAVLLHYLHLKNKVPLYVAEASLIKYPEMAEKILPIYGDQPEFLTILTAYGTSVIPPIYYFVTNDVHSVDAMYYSAQTMHSASRGVHSAKARVEGWLGFGTSDKKSPKASSHAAEAGDPNAGATNPGGAATVSAADRTQSSNVDGNLSERSGDNHPPLTPTMRGWFAIQFIHKDGHDFLSQFAMAKDGHVTWIQSERILQDLNSFFGSGIRKLDTKYQTGRKVTAGDVGWAAADVIGTFGGMKLLRVGKAAEAASRTTEFAEDASRTARVVDEAGGSEKMAQDVVGAAREAKETGRSAGFAQGTAKFGHATARGVKYSKYGKLPLIAATGYLAIFHPSLISDALAVAAHILGLPVWLVQCAGWFLILLPLLYICSWILKYLIRPSIFVLRLSAHGLSRIEQWSSRSGARPNKTTDVTSTPAT
ncbi:hypothetical protein C27AD_07720 [Salinisphaera hydrothermalis C27AD]